MKRLWSRAMIGTKGREVMHRLPGILAMASRSPVPGILVEINVCLK